MAKQFRQDQINAVQRRFTNRIERADAKGKTKRVQRLKNRKKGAVQFMKAWNYHADNAPDEVTDISVGGKSWIPQIKRSYKDTVQKKNARSRAIENMIQGAWRYISGNHEEWYKHYDVSLVAINANTRKSTSMPMGVMAENHKITAAMTIPMIAANPNTADNSYDAAINLIYANIRKANSGAVNYTVEDLRTYIEHMRYVRILHSVMHRGYQTLNFASTFDSEGALNLMTAIGLDYESWKENAANIMNYGNIIGLQIEKLMPLGMDLLKRDKWMYSNIFTDGPSQKATFYVFTPLACEVAGTLKSCLYPSDISGMKLTNGVSFGRYMETYCTYKDTAVGGNVHVDGVTWDDFKDLVNTEVSYIQQSNIFSVIAGDILKAFGTDAIYEHSVWTATEAPQISVDDTALWQINNSQGIAECIHYTYTGAGNATNYYIESRNAYPSVLTTPRLEEMRNIVENMYLNVPDNGATQAKAISVTRLAVAYGEVRDVNDRYHIDIVSHGTDIPLAAEFIYGVVNYDASYDSGIYRTSKSNRGIVCGSLDDFVGPPLSFINDPDGARPLMNLCMRWSQCDWAPRMRCLAQGSGQDGMGVFPIVGAPDLFDTATFALTDASQVDTYHSTATYSLYYTPEYLQDQNVIRVG